MARGDMSIAASKLWPGFPAPQVPADTSVDVSAADWPKCGAHRGVPDRSAPRTEEYERWQRAASSPLTAEDEEAIWSLAADLPALWQAPTTTSADRQRVARLLLERVVVTVDKTSERVDVELHWV